MSEPFAAAAEAADDFVGAQQHIVLTADALDFGPITGRRINHAAGTLERFGDKRGNIFGAQFQQPGFQLLRCLQAEFKLGEMAPVAEPVWFADEADIGNRQAAEFMHHLHAAQRPAADGRTVIRVVAADQDFLVRLAGHLPETPHHADHRIVDFRTGVGIHQPAEIRRQQLEQLGCQFSDCRMRRVKKLAAKRQVVNLRLRRIGQVGMAITDSGAPQT